jgi:hypothetical protein
LGFGAAAFSDDDPVRAHSQRSTHKLTLVGAAFLVQVGRTRFKFDDVPLLKL